MALFVCLSGPGAVFFSGGRKLFILLGLGCSTWNSGLDFCDHLVVYYVCYSGGDCCGSLVEAPPPGLGGYIMQWTKGISVWQQRMKAASVSPRTIKNYTQWMQRMARKWPALKASQFARAVELSSAMLADQGLSPTTIQHYQCAAARFALDMLKWDKHDARDLIRAKSLDPSPDVPTVEEVKRIAAALPDPYRLPCLLMYGCGLRLGEVLGLRLRDVDLDRKQLTIQLAKGQKSRRIPIPDSLVPLLLSAVNNAMALYQSDLAAGGIGASARYKGQAWTASQARRPEHYWLFPQESTVPDTASGLAVRVPIHASRLQKAMKAARLSAKVAKHITPHSLRHAYAVHSLEAGLHLRTIQEHLGHASLETTAKYLKIATVRAEAVPSSLFDRWLDDTFEHQSALALDLQRSA